MQINPATGIAIFRRFVKGRHRLEAAKRLGWTHIDCAVVDGDEIGAELWEIAENLHRLDLTKEQRDEHIRRYAELLEAQRCAASIVPQNAEQSQPRIVGGPKSITTQVAEATGLSDDTVRRALSPKPPVFIKSALEPESQYDACLRRRRSQQLGLRR